MALTKTIRIGADVQKKLLSLRIVPNETYDHIISRLIKEHGGR